MKKKNVPIQKVSRPTYKVREVECGDCQHVFMWINDFSGRRYERFDGKKGCLAVCPKCGKGIIVFDGEIIANVPDKGIVARPEICL
jgi:hypothetical protein